MTKTVTLEIPDALYKTLSETSAQVGQTPEETILFWIEYKIQQSQREPLLELAGAFEFDAKDLSARHDDYVGEALRDDLQAGRIHTAFTVVYQHYRNS